MQADRVFIATTVLMPILLGVLVRVTPTPFGLANSTPVGGLNVNAIQMLMILVLAAVVCGTTNSIRREFIKERDIYERERMMGLSATAYLLSKIMVLSLISTLPQAAVIVVLGPCAQRVPSWGPTTGTALIEIFVALAALDRCLSSLLGFTISTLVTRGDQTMPILVGVTLVQAVLSGGLFPLTGGISSVAVIAPARWGLGALASTINLNVIQSSVSQGPNGQPPDALWTHDTAHWLTSILVMVGIGIVWLVIARLRLASIGPRKRKENKKSTCRAGGSRSVLNWGARLRDHAMKAACFVGAERRRRLGAGGDRLPDQGEELFMACGRARHSSRDGVPVALVNECGALAGTLIVSRRAVVVCPRNVTLAGVQHGEHLLEVDTVPRRPAAGGTCMSTRVYLPSVSTKAPATRIVYVSPTSPICGSGALVLIRPRDGLAGTGRRWNRIGVTGS